MAIWELSNEWVRCDFVINTGRKLRRVSCLKGAQSKLFLKGIATTLLEEKVL